MQLVRLFHQMHPDEPSAEYTASNQLSGFEELWVSLWKPSDTNRCVLLEYFIVYIQETCSIFL